MLDDPRVERFVGPNAEYYRARWQRFVDQPESKISFNWAALIGNIIWLAYRKLYVPLLWVTALAVADVVFVLYVEEKQLVSESFLVVWNNVFAVVYLGLVGLYGNYWYWKKFLRTGGLEDPKKLRSKGGTSAVAPTLVVIALVTPVAWVLYNAAPILFGDGTIGDPPYIFGRTGPLTLEEVRVNLLDRIDVELGDARLDCIYREIEERVAGAGDPETLDPSTVEMMPEDNWDSLDADGKRLILSQVVLNKAFFECPRRNF
ncbi:MAG: DUF2628 domain-containing protein [Woeseiaceae bacterium]|nr:DUF2628 domain-containing protein [Woeseiaceae bacterium]